MQARLIAYPPDDAAIIRLVRPGQALRIGRVGEDCPAGQLVLHHPSVSRAHAELHGDGGHWRLLDLGSKNGSHVDGVAISDTRLDRGCWLRFGDVHCEFALLTAAEAEAAEHDRRVRRHAATAHTTRIEQLTRFGDLLDASLDAVLGLAHCERGFVLIDDGADFVVSASQSLAPAALAGRSFSGSVGAVRRAMDQRRIVVVNDIGREAWLANRESVVAAGLSALVCVPLMDEDRVLGAIYADRVAPGPAISTLDLELLQAFAENAAVWISARRTSEQLELQSDMPDRRHAERDDAGWSRIIAAHRQSSDQDA
ncbi:GAF domain-containing protein [Luteimonas terricola]|uniref:FHA domain-containing protein n=1 Tax=Luteimonas terricola TaxID=645597 RepID=A0ABQ2EAW1_9GAMM|nr:GAF domain-containing protein [Luteimonas terricola]GGK03472.1 hypothetical protein GCM10011394_10660 [Luteimonas terricola]